MSEIGGPNSPCGGGGGGGIPGFTAYYGLL